LFAQVGQLEQYLGAHGGRSSRSVIEKAMEEHCNAIVVDSQSTAFRCRDFLTRNNMKPQTFLVVADCQVSLFQCTKNLSVSFRVLISSKHIVITGSVLNFTVFIKELLTKGQARIPSGLKLLDGVEVLDANVTTVRALTLKTVIRDNEAAQVNQATM